MNVIFIVGDGLRRNSLGCYGNNKNVTPRIDKLAEDGVLFEDAYACSDHTDPSFTTMLSGKYPLSHGITRHGTRSHGVTKHQIQIFNRTTVLLSEILKIYGYYNIAFDWLGRWHKRGYDFYGETNGFSFASGLEKVLSFLPEKWGRRFKIKLHRSGFALPGRSGKYYVNLAMKFINKKCKKPFFMLLHVWDTHTPFDTLPSSYVRRFCQGKEEGEKVEDMLKRMENYKWREIAGNYHLYGIEYVQQIPAMYDAAACFFDHLVDQLLNCLEESGILDDTLIVLTSDHGDNIFRNGVFVGHFGLYDPVIHVPLILWGSCLPRGKRVKGFVQHVDLVPTIIELLNIDFVTSNLDGKSLMSLILGKRKSIRSSVLAQAAAVEERYAIRTKDYKLIWSSPSGHRCLHDFDPVDGKCRVELYDLNKDPEETENIAEVEPDVVEKMQEKLLRRINELKIKREKLIMRSEIRSIKEKISKLKKKRF